MLYFCLVKTEALSPRLKITGMQPPKSFAKEIGFTAEQMQQYDTLAKLHREKMKNTFDDMRNSKEQQFKDIGRSGFSDSSIAEAITCLRENKNDGNAVYNHMLEVRKICSLSNFKIWLTVL